MSDDHAITTTAPAPVVRVHPVVQAAIAAGASPAELREMLAIQREWEAGEALRAYTRARVALRRDLPAVLAKDTLVDYTGAKGRVRYTHTSLAAAMDAVTPALTRHGFALAWVPGRTERGEVEVTCRLTHTDGHSETCTLSAPVDTSGHKSTAQGVASTTTLLSRYTALALLGIATADMVEPTGEPSAGDVDPRRNLRAAARVVERGKTREAAEAHVGRPVAEWTTADLERLREWLGPALDGRASECGS